MSRRPGDQHKSNSAAAANPFLESEQQEKRQQISVYTAQEIAILQSRLDKNLGPEYISSRPGAGGQKVYYLGAEKVINLANEVFGFNGWNSSIQNIQIDFVDEQPHTGKVSLGLSVIVRVTLRDGTYHEDVGYGHVENAKGKAAAFEKAKKQGTSDGLKRTLRNFGRVLGNCVYDKDYLTKVTKMKVAPTRWDPDDLHRHSDFAAKKAPVVKTESKSAVLQSNGTDSGVPETADSFDAMDFDDGVFDDDELGNPDEFVLPVEPQVPAKRAQTLTGPAPNHGTGPSGAMTTPSRPPQGAVNGFRPQGARNTQAPQRQPSHQANAQQSHPSLMQVPNSRNEQSSSPGLPSQHFVVPPPHTNGEVAANMNTGFFSARAAGNIDENNNIVTGIAPTFNPHSESPSIRRDPKVDHSSSKRLLRNLNVDPDIPKPEDDAQQPEQARKAPLPSQGLQSPMNMGRGPNSGQYRPPTRRGPDGSIIPPRIAQGAPGVVDRVGNAAHRQPLTDVSNAANQYQTTAITPEGTDAKRQRLSGPPYSSADENKLSGEAG